jgi:hypothetical protein
MPNAVSRAVGSKRRAWKRGKAGVGSDSGISDLAERGYSFEDAAEGELNWTERTGEPRRWRYACNEVLVDESPP